MDNPLDRQLFKQRDAVLNLISAMEKFSSVSSPYIVEEFIRREREEQREDREKILSDAINQLARFEEQVKTLKNENEILNQIATNLEHDKNLIISNLTNERVILNREIGEVKGRNSYLETVQRQTGDIVIKVNEENESLKTVIRGEGEKIDILIHENNELKMSEKHLLNKVGEKLNIAGDLLSHILICMTRNAVPTPYQAIVKQAYEMYMFGTTIKDPAADIRIDPDKVKLADWAMVHMGLKSTGDLLKEQVGTEDSYPIKEFQTGQRVIVTDNITDADDNSEDLTAGMCGTVMEGGNPDAGLYEVRFDDMEYSVFVYWMHLDKAPDDKDPMPLHKFDADDDSAQATYKPETDPALHFLNQEVPKRETKTIMTSTPVQKDDSTRSRFLRAGEQSSPVNKTYEGFKDRLSNAKLGEPVVVQFPKKNFNEITVDRHYYKGQLVICRNHHVSKLSEDFNVERGVTGVILSASSKNVNEPYAVEWDNGVTMMCNDLQLITHLEHSDRVEVIAGLMSGKFGTFIGYTIFNHGPMMAVIDFGKGVTAQLHSHEIKLSTSPRGAA